MVQGRGFKGQCASEPRVAREARQLNPAHHKYNAVLGKRDVDVLVLVHHHAGCDSRVHAHHHTGVAQKRTCTKNANSKL